MRGTRMLAAFTAFISFVLIGSHPVKADQATAANMQSVLRSMYNVDQAEAILNNKKAVLAACKAGKASAIEIAVAQSAVNDAVNLLNTLNAMIARDTTLIQAAPAGVVNPPTLAVNSLTAQGAWNDFINREKVNHVIVFPKARIPSAAEVARASAPFVMFH